MVSGCCTVAVQVDNGLKWNRLKPLLMGLEAVHQGDSVAHTGFEPVISALRGRCPRPLDECAAFCLLAFFNSYATALILPVSKRIVNSNFCLLASRQDGANQHEKACLYDRS